ncbi:MAG TPA: hypothetical protein VFW73_02355 [Lacipirellulaceae bacterium]|nr:hypothetical protein [Lacipirellulaceae bacterium]
MTENTLGDQLRSWRWYSLVIGVLGTIGCIIGAVVQWQQFLRSYLYSYFFVLGLAIGGMALVMIHQLIGGAWGLLVRRTAEAQMKTLPLMALLFLPIAFGIWQIYPWAGIHLENSQSNYQFWRNYLIPSWFYIRAVAYFVIWIVLMVLMAVWSRTQDKSPSVRNFWRSYKMSGFGLLLLGITTHFAAMDWMMSLQRGFTSTIFGALIFCHWVLSAYAFTVIIFCWLLARPEFDSVLSSKAMNDLGSLLFTILTLWAYLTWFQFMLIWMADLPHGNVWYLIRWRGTWGWIASFLLIFQFVIPFLLLLLRVIKQSRLRLGLVAALVFVGQLLFMYYYVVPVFGLSGWAYHWTDFLTPLAVGGIWFAFVLWILTLRPLLPVYDLNYEQALLLREIDLEEMAREEALTHE